MHIIQAIHREITQKMTRMNGMSLLLIANRVLANKENSLDITISTCVRSIIIMNHIVSEVLIAIFPSLAFHYPWHHQCHS